mmetsp:Transcript_45129/g.105492  ORF Transcript_45129/g.105492 Transcript_45129/m.105492 type:complete len:239 (+) Transcript_45129:738-1454(+)
MCNFFGRECEVRISSALGRLGALGKAYEKLLQLPNLLVKTSRFPPVLSLALAPLQAGSNKAFRREPRATFAESGGKAQLKVGVRTSCFQVQLCEKQGSLLTADLHRAVVSTVNPLVLLRSLLPLHAQELLDLLKAQVSVDALRFAHEAIHFLRGKVIAKPAKDLVDVAGTDGTSIALVSVERQLEVLELGLIQALAVSVSLQEVQRILVVQLQAFGPPFGILDLRRNLQHHLQVAIIV